MTSKRDCTHPNWVSAWKDSVGGCEEAASGFTPAYEDLIPNANFMGRRSLLDMGARSVNKCAREAVAMSRCAPWCTSHLQSDLCLLSKLYGFFTSNSTVDTRFLLLLPLYTAGLHQVTSVHITTLRHISSACGGSVVSRSSDFTIMVFKALPSYQGAVGSRSNWTRGLIMNTSLHNLAALQTSAPGCTPSSLELFRLSNTIRVIGGL